LSAYNKGYEKIGEISSYFISNYCKFHNIDYFIEKDENASKGRPFAWAKVPLIKRFLGEYDWVVWIDADAFIVDKDLILNDYLDDSFEMIFCKDINGLNSGVGFFKGSRFNEVFLNKVWNYTSAIHHVWWEQKAIRDLIAKDKILASKVKLLDCYPLNVSP